MSCIFFCCMPQGICHFIRMLEYYFWLNIEKFRQNNYVLGDIFIVHNLLYFSGWHIINRMFHSFHTFVVVDQFYLTVWLFHWVVNKVDLVELQPKILHNYGRCLSCVVKKHWLMQNASSWNTVINYSLIQEKQYTLKNDAKFWYIGEVSEVIWNRLNVIFALSTN